MTSLGKDFTPKQVKQIRLEFDVLLLKKHEHATSRKASEKEKKNYVEWNELVAGLDKLDGMAKLYYALYTLIPPLRADYGDVKIMKDKDVEVSMRTGDNIYIIDTNEMIISNFKTSNNKEPIVFYPNQKLEKIIQDSLKETPRDYLLYNYVKKTKDESISPNYLGHQLQIITNDLFGKSISINDLRHSFVESHNITNSGLQEINTNARLMGHSVRTAINMYMKNDIK